MSYDIQLVHPISGKTLDAPEPHALTGGTYAVGGTTECWLNVTYNYSKHFYKVLGEKGIRTIYGMRADQSVPILRAAADKLGDDTDSDYWEPTEGNAKKALLNLISLAELRPSGIWEGD